MYRFSVLLLLQLKQYHISGRFSKRIHSFFPVQTEVTLAFSKLPADWKLLFQLTFLLPGLIVKVTSSVFEKSGSYSYKPSEVEYELSNSGLVTT